jgi:phosphomannose isomerase type I
MASSDNVVRAGLTRKYVDSAQLVEITEFSALPPVRVAPEHPSSTTDRFLAPAQEFELSVTTLAPGMHTSRVDEVAVPGEGPRIIIATSGSITLHVSEEQGGDSVELSRGQAVFISAAERRVWAYGTGSFVQVAAP